MSALSEALEHSQAKALTALFKAYTRREEEPDDDLFRQLMHGVGLDDDVQVSFLLRAWTIMRMYPEPLSGSGRMVARVPMKPEPQAVEDRRWTGGKHKGTSLAETPQDYLEWAAGGHPDPIGRAAAQEELQRRADGVPF